MIKLIKSSFYNEKETKQKIADFILQADILSMHQECAKFEKNFAKKQDRKYAVFVTSGSSANLVLIQALMNLNRLKKADSIGFSSLTWSTNVMPIIQLGLSPFALDCSLKTMNISPAELQKNISKIKCLFLTNALGFSDNLKEIKTICEKNNVLFIEDNCESLGSKSNGKLLGNFGFASTFSFFVGHHISTIEGGMICTDDEELYNALLTTRIHGWDRNLSSPKQIEIRDKNNINEFYAKYTFYDLAFNARPTEINGFIGNIQLNFWDEIVSKRAENFKLFQDTVKQNDDFMPLELPHMNLISNFAMPIVCRNKELLEKYKTKFIQNGIEIRPIIAGNIENQPFYKKYVASLNNCQNSNFIHENGLYFGNNPELTKEELSLLCNLLKK
jgi:CDP-4-dehydro-6-deoxyglucose reductase, E1